MFRAWYDEALIRSETPVIGSYVVDTVASADDQSVCDDVMLTYVNFAI